MPGPDLYTVHRTKTLLPGARFTLLQTKRHHNGAVVRVVRTGDGLGLRGTAAGPHGDGNHKPSQVQQLRRPGAFVQTEPYSETSCLEPLLLRLRCVISLTLQAEKASHHKRNFSAKTVSDANLIYSHEA